MVRKMWLGHESCDLADKSVVTAAADNEIRDSWNANVMGLVAGRTLSV